VKYSIPNVVAFTIAALIAFSTVLRAEEPKELSHLRREYQLLKHASEADRVRYITRLVRLRETFSRLDEVALLAIDAEIIRHPMSSAVDSKALSKTLVGQWQSPRHSYFYHNDGTWASDEDIPMATGGTWRIERNRFFQNYHGNQPDPGNTIILLTDTDFIYGTEIAPYYLRKGTVFPWH